MKHIFLMTLMALCFAISANAEECEQEAYASLAEIPEPLLNLPRIGYEYPEQYLYDFFYPIRIHSRDKNSIDQQDITIFKKTIIQDAQRGLLKDFMMLDRDFDGIATRAEVIDYLKTTSSYQKQYDQGDLDADIQRFMRFDKNQDDKITKREILDSAEQDTHPENNDELKKMERLLTLDPNKDGRLTANELNRLAFKAFRTIDTDKDGIMSETERTGALQAHQKQMNEIWGKSHPEQQKTPQ